MSKKLDALVRANVLKLEPGDEPLPQRPQRVFLDPGKEAGARQQQGRSVSGTGMLRGLANLPDPPVRELVCISKDEYRRGRYDNLRSRRRPTGGQRSDDGGCAG